MNLRVVIVDDEPLAIEGVEIELARMSGVEIVARCADGPEAVRRIRELEPDLVYLDIHMPGLDGFGVIDAVGPDRMPPVVFLTAYDEHAVQAFRVHAVDYLLKPVEPEELRASLERARRGIETSRVAEHSRALREALLGDADGARAGTVASPARLVVRTASRVYLVEPDEIEWVAADGDYVTLHTAEKSHVLRLTMHAIDSQLAPHGFGRIHRSSIVNLKRVRELVVNEHGDYEVVLGGGARLRLSRSYRDAFLARLTAGG